MRQQNGVLKLDQLLWDFRLVLEHVEACSQNLAAAQRLDEGPFVDQ